MKKIGYVGYSLMIVAYTILLVEILDFKIGLIISISTIIVVLIALKYLSVKKEHDGKIVQIVGNDLKTTGDIKIENVNLDVDIKSDRQGNK